MITLKTPHYRIDDPQTGLAVLFRSVAVPSAVSPKIVPGLVPTRDATTFMTWAHAAEFFATYLQGEVLEIARVDA